MIGKPDNLFLVLSQTKETLARYSCTFLSQEISEVLPFFSLENFHLHNVGSRLKFWSKLSRFAVYKLKRPEIGGLVEISMVLPFYHFKKFFITMRVPDSILVSK